MTKELLAKFLRKHKLWLKGYECGERLDLSNINLRDTDLSDADLRGANLVNADLSNADLRDANLRDADLRYADLSNANLRDADLRYADLKGANLINADSSNANLKDTNLKDANLRCTNLSGARGLLSAIDYLEKNFEKTKDGYIAYKSFGLHYEVPSYWKIEKNSIIKENVDTNISIYGSYGINAGTLECVKEQMGSIIRPIYALLIKYEWLAGVVVPYNANGLIRCERAMILKEIK